MNTKKYYSPKDCAEAHGHSIRYWQKLAYEIPGTIKMGRCLFISIIELEKFIKQHEVQNEKNKTHRYLLPNE